MAKKKKSEDAEIEVNEELIVDMDDDDFEDDDESDDGQDEDEDEDEDEDFSVEGAAWSATESDLDELETGDLSLGQSDSKILDDGPFLRSQDRAPGATFDGSLMEEMLSLEAKVEAILFASPKPMKPSEIEELIANENTTSKDIIHAIDRLSEFYETRAGGFKLEYLKNLGYQFRSVSAAGPIMERMFSTRPRPLSRAAMETLAIIAYRQPSTRAEIEFIRGVDAGSILKNLLERDLVKCVGRKSDAGRPMVFGTTDEFLRVFRLGSLEELPSLDSFQTDPELIKTAMSKLESEEAISVEGFIADDGKDVSEDELETLQSIAADGEDDLEITNTELTPVEATDTPSQDSFS